MLCAIACLPGCVTTKGNACDGWEQISMAAASADYLTKHDLLTAAQILAHNEHGVEIGCWKAGKRK